MTEAKDDSTDQTGAVSWKDRGGWKPKHSGETQTSIVSFGSRFPVRPLFRFEALGLGDHGLSFDGRHGRRTVSLCRGGTLTGDRLGGRVAEDVSNEWRIHDATGSDGFAVEGLVTLLADSGETILMKYVGRGGGRYGADGYRIGAVFEAPAATLGWLNSVCAAGRVAIDGDTLRFELFELLGQVRDDSQFLDVEPLYRMTGRDTVGDRLTIHGAVSNRYFTMAESGCLAEGALDGEWIKGMSWGPHRMAFSETSMPWQIDMKVMLDAKGGVPVLQQYLGTVPDRTAPGAAADDSSWRTVAVFETDVNGELAWLNGVVAVGIGWTEAGEAHYYYYVMQ